MEKKGFTILEILVVISVIAILIGIAIPRFKGMQDEANIIKVKSELKTIQAAVESYRNQHSNAMPADVAAMAAVTPQIIETGMTNPFTNAEYLIGTDGDQDIYYVIYALKTTDGTAASVTATGTVTVGDTYCVSNGLGCEPQN